MSNKLYAVAGLFDTPDEIASAARKVADEGYKHFDVHSSYPLHGIDSKMKMKRSPMGWFALGLALTGLLTGLALIYFTTNVDYPLVIGGKPLFALPAYVPVLFELTVLISTCGTVISMFVLFFKFPNNSHPLHDSDYIKKVSVDKFGVVIEAKNEKFELDKAKAFLTEIGSKEIQEIYFDEKEVSHKHILFEPKFLSFLGFTAILVAVSAYSVLNIWLFLPPWDWMMEQSRLNAQGESEFYMDNAAMRIPVEGTVAKGFIPYPYKGEPELAGQFLANPFESTEDNLTEGEDKFNTYCSPCHGYFGEGDSRLNNLFPNPPTLHSEKVREWTDGRIYHVMTDGQNVMPAYDKIVTRDERWKIVLYIRALQKAKYANEEDLK